jgi:hypothetical protein
MHGMFDAERLHPSAMSLTMSNSGFGTQQYADALSL